MVFTKKEAEGDWAVVKGGIVLMEQMYKDFIKNSYRSRF
jgi:hypothetical protein